MVAATASATASTVSPLPPPSSSGPCAAGGLFGEVSPVGHALVGIQYADPQTGDSCILEQGATLPGDELIVTLFTPDPVPSSNVTFDVEEFRWGSETVSSPGPNNTTVSRSVPVQVDVVWSNATVPANPGEIQRFGLSVPPVFTTPNSAANLSVSVLGLSLQFRIATPGTGIPIPETVGGLIGWLAAMTPVGIVVFLSGFAPGEWFLRRMRYVSTAMWAAAFALLVTVIILVGVLADFVGFLYWLGDVGVAGLALVLLLPIFLWGCVFWIFVRKNRVPLRILRGPIAKATTRGEPVSELLPVRVYGGGTTGQEEELVEGLGIGGPGAAWYRLLGVRVKWKPTELTDRPTLVRYEFPHGKLPIEGEYAGWPGRGGARLEVKTVRPSTVWFPWRKSVRARLDPPDPNEPNGHGPAPQAKRLEKTLQEDDWAHRGFFLGLRHGEARVAALGSPDFVGPDMYIRGVSSAAEFGREAQRCRTALVVQSARLDHESWLKAEEIQAVHDRMEQFGGAPEVLEGVRELSTRSLDPMFDPGELMDRLERRGVRRVDYRPPGTSKYSYSSETKAEVDADATNPTPPESRGKGK
ncbi:MAG TPA: hypothetical protein VGU43_04565 [Thermoplasmata archaeon]|nr:hypothetical protein [Thermoplasmata archaeon]